MIGSDRTKNWTLCLALLAVLGLPVGSRARGEATVRLYVSTRGDDAWSGRLDAPDAAHGDGPFASIRGARDALRRLRKATKNLGPVTILVRAGSYELGETLRFLPEDGGSAQAPVVYEAYPGERPILRGGRRIDGFVAHNGQIMKADLASQGLKGAKFKELFCAGQRLPLARYPNFDPQNPYGGGWAFADGPRVPMYENRPGEDFHTLHYKAADQRTWSKPGEVEVFVFPRYNWWNNIVPIRSVDPSTRTIRLAGEASYAIRAGDRYYFRNALEDLDAPGEWYLDRASDTLYIWPPAPLVDDNEVVAPVVGTLIAIEPGTAHLTLRGFTLEACTGEAVVLHDTSQCASSAAQSAASATIITVQSVSPGADRTGSSATTFPTWDRMESP